MSSEQAPRATHLVIIGQYAGFVTRLIAWLVDYAIISLVLAGLAALAGFFLQLDAINNLLGTNALAQVILTVLAIAVAISFLFLYVIGFWMLAGQTPGKRFMGVRIMRTNGERLHFKSAIVRLLGYLVSSFLFLGYLWVLYDNRRQAWHDKLAGTVVVYSWPEEGSANTLVGKKVSGFRARRQERKQAEELKQQQA